MRIDLACPVELRRCQMPSPGYPVCEMLFYNLTDKPVGSMQICFVCYDENGEQTMRSVERLPVKEAPPREMFSLDTVIELTAQAAGMDVSVMKVWFDDGTVWRTESSSVREFEPTPVLEDKQLEVMKQQAGDDAITYPSDQGSVWVCICGRPNSASEDTCRRCGRDKHDIFVNYNKAAIEKIIFQQLSAAEEQQRLEKEEQDRIREIEAKKQHDRRQKRRIITACVLSALVILGLVFGYFYYLKPHDRYSTAIRWFENGRYGDAKEVFGELNEPDYFFGKYEKKFSTFLSGKEYSYSDMITECDYRTACSALAEGTNLSAVWEAFEALSGYKDSDEKAMEARYLYAEKLFDKGQWEDSIAAFSLVDPAYAAPADEKKSVRPVASQMKQHALYQWALDLEDAKDYAAAREKFLLLPGFEQADRHAADCLHTMAAQDMAEGNYAGAIEKYLQLPQYADTAHQLQIAYYSYADQLYVQGDYAQAAVYFDKAGKYLDAERRGKYQCRYAPAVALMAEGRLEEAAEIFAGLKNYEDSEMQYFECLYLMALQKHEEGDDAGALALLDQTADYAHADALRFDIARSYLDRGMEAEALEQFLLIPEYRVKAAGEDEEGGDTESSADYIQQLRYRAGIRCMNNKDYAAAAEYFAALGDYEDSAENLTSCRYSVALSYIDEGRNEEALAILQEMPDYENAGEKIKLATFNQAKVLETAGDYAGAMALYSGLGNFQNADGRREHCAVVLAQEEEKAGDLEAAFALLDGCTGTEAIRQRNEMGYTLAAQMETDGDLSGAAARFSALGDFKDSKSRAAACRDAYYSEAVETIGTAMKNKDYLTVIETMDGLDTTILGSEYAYLLDYYKEACYLLANSLYSDGKVYEAYGYYIRIRDYRDVSEKKLNRTCYHIIGKWVAFKGVNEGVRMEFRGDGTCNINGKEYYYTVPTKYSLKIGDRPDALNQSYSLISEPTARGSRMTMKRDSDGANFYMERAADED
ncbi:MAG: hypothetical protein CW338_06155 [Clostridiales bacterium]|nr:hypothetical protein [Clostridiales bacterium]